MREHRFAVNQPDDQRFGAAMKIGLIASKNGFSIATMAMAAIVIASNVLVQYPLGDWLTFGAFTYPIAFLVTDITNRRYGAARAHQVVFVGFGFAVVLSVLLATPRIAIASGTAFLIAQSLDVVIFNRLRALDWWRAPLVSSLLSSLVDTVLFFTLAFAAWTTVLGPGDPHASEPLALLGGAPRWVGWAIGDLGVKLGLAILMLPPYRAMTIATTHSTSGPPSP